MTYDTAERTRLQTNYARVMALMADGRWHSSVELMRVGGMRAVGRLNSCKADGYTYDKRKQSAGVYEYRLRKVSDVGQQQVSLPLSQEPNPCR